MSMGDTTALASHQDGRLLENEGLLDPEVAETQHAPGASPESNGEPGGDANEEDDACGPAYFEEEEECQQLLRRVSELLPSNGAVLLPTVGQDPHGVAALVEDKFTKIMDRYQESSHLLHPHLEKLMEPLVELLIRFMPSATEVWELESALMAAAGKDKESGDGGGAASPISGGAGEHSCASPSSAAASGDMVVRTNELGQNFDMFDPDAPKHPLHLVCRALYTIIKTAGEKCCTSYFPNDVRYYEDVFYSLRFWKEDPARLREWEVRYCLLLWLSNLVLVPFDLIVIDTHATPLPLSRQKGKEKEKEEEEEARGEKDEEVTKQRESGVSLSDAMLVTAVAFLADTSKCREGAALLIARLLTRPDSSRHRQVFFTYAREVLSGVAREKRTCGGDSGPGGGDGSLSQLGAEESDSIRTFLFPGILLAIAKAMKLGKRNEMVKYAPQLIGCVSELYGRRKNDCLLCKTAVKVEQRLVLSMLRRKTATWKYKKHVASLATNLTAGDEQCAKTTSASVGQEDEEKAESDGDDNDEAIDGDEEQLEEGIGLLLEAIGHKDTVVRWSAAKGIGRVCERLPRGLAADVIEVVMNSFQEDETNDRQWHGALLALAELCRRSLISADDKLESVVKFISKGLAFDLSKGTYSVGSHVRDAACYTCWSIARAYDAADLEPHVHDLSSALVVTSLYDREVNVRRAAAAAFQECVGRLGNFPNGIALVTAMDFFSLSSLKNAYLTVGPVVAGCVSYRAAMLEELVSVKLSHWDKAVRGCAAVALGRLAPLETDVVLSEVFPELQRRVLDTSVAARHGAVLGLAELVRGLPISVWTAEQREQIATVVVRLDTSKLFVTRGGEYTREACCELLSACAERMLPLPEFVPVVKLSGATAKARTLGKMQEFLEGTWRNILSWLQLCAAEAFRRFAAAYYTTYQPAFHGKMITKMLEGCRSGKSPLERRGFLAAIGGLPTSLLVASPEEAVTEAATELCTPQPPFLISVLATLQRACLVHPEEDAELADPEARCNAVRSLARVVVSVPPTHSCMASALYADVLATMLAALQDYAVDKRGDVGSFVRLAVLQSIPSVVGQYGLASNYSSSSSVLCSWQMCVAVLQGAVKAAMEKSDRVRAAAGAALVSLLVDRGERVEALLSEKKPASAAAEEETGSNFIDLQTACVEVAWLAQHLRNLHSGLSGAGDAASSSEAQSQQHPSPQGEMIWSSPHCVLLGLAPMVLRRCPTVFAFPALEGIVLAAGDLSAHVRRPAVAALLAAYSKKQGAASSEVGEHSETAQQRSERLSRGLVHVAVKHVHSERVLVPWSRTVDCVLNEHDLFAHEACAFGVVNVLRAELKHFATAITVLLPLVSLLANLCRSPCQAAREASWSLALTMVASRYPKVRAKMASDLYAALLVLSSDGNMAPERSTGCLNAMQTLSATQWDSADVTRVRTARNSLYAMLGISPPTKKAAEDGGESHEMEMRPVRQGRAQVASSYMHLVREAGY